MVENQKTTKVYGQTEGECQSIIHPRAYENYTGGLEGVVLLVNNNMP